MASEQKTIHHHRLVKEYNLLLTQARDLPGFHEFMRPKSMAELVLAATTGTVVVVNVHANRCDALVLRPGDGDVRHMPLPDLLQRDVVELQGKMKQVLQSKLLRQRGIHIRPRKPCDDFGHVLRALWNTLVKPVLDWLGYNVCAL